MVAAMRTALTIAGSDSGGGAGIQADLKSFAAVGVHGTSVLTCVTAQNTKAVTSIFPVPAGEIRAQLRAVLDDFDVRAAKTGMLYSAQIVEAVAGELRDAAFPVVVDPVMVATVGARLERDDFRDALIDRLLPRADLVTPNRREAERLSGRTLRTIADMGAAARAIHDLGARAVLVKGGHVAGELVDVFYDGRVVRHLRGFRYPKELHGAGCTLAASVAAYLAQGEAMLRAVESARRRVAAGFLTSYRAGHGVEIINSSFREDRYGAWSDLTEAAGRLSTAVPSRFRPRGRPDLVYALPGAMAPGDLCAWRRDEGIARFGVSAAEARVPLAVLHVNPTLRASATLMYPAKLASRFAAGRPGFLVLPPGRHAGTSDARGIERAIVEAGTAVDVLADIARGGTETTLRVFGETPVRVLDKARRLVRAAGP